MDQDGAALAALVEDLEKEFGPGVGQGQEAQPVDDEELEAGQLVPHHALGAVAVAIGLRQFRRSRRAPRFAQIAGGASPPVLSASLVQPKQPGVLFRGYEGGILCPR